MFVGGTEDISDVLMTKTLEIYERFGDPFLIEDLNQGNAHYYNFSLESEVCQSQCLGACAGLYDVSVYTTKHIRGSRSRMAIIKIHQI